MKLTIRARHIDLDPELRDQIRRKLAFALGRVAGAIRQVDVTIADINGPRGGLDKLARIQIRGSGWPPIIIEDLGYEPLSAVSVAVERAARAVVRRIARRRDLGAPLVA